MDDRICPVDIYIRVSTTEQSEHGYSVGEQEKKLRAFCLAMGYQVHRAAIDPGFSGASLDRPAIQDVIKDVRAGKIKKVLVWKLDRLSRSQRDTMVLLEDVFLPAGVAFQSLEESFDTGTPIGRCMVGILSAFAQMERENIKIRTSMGREAAVRSGRFVAVPPFGYKHATDAAGRHCLVPDPCKAQALKEIYQMYNQGQSIAATWKHIKDKYGFAPFKANMSRVMGNPIYKGYVSINGKEYKGLHEPLVSEEDWAAANARLSMNQPYHESTSLLTGIIYCGDCGARIQAKTMRATANKPKWRKYVCYSVSRSNPDMVRSDHCQNRHRVWRVEELDAYVMGEVGKLQTDPEAIRAMLDEWGGKDMQEEVEALSSELEQTEKQIKRILDLYQAGAVELDEVQRRLAPLKDKKAALSASIEEARADVSAMPDLDEVMESLKDFSILMEEGSFEERRIAIHSLIDRITVNNDEVAIKWSFECE